MEDLLSPEEKDALLGSFGQAGPRRPQVTLAVFPSVSQLPPESTATLSHSLRAWSGLVAGDLARQLRVQCSPESPRVQMLARSALSAKEECQFWAALYGREEHYVIVSVPRPFAAAVCERAFGAPLELGEDRELTGVEQQVVQGLGRSWVGYLEEAWPDCSPEPCTPPESGVPEGDGSSNWLRFTTDLPCGPIVGSVSVAMAPSTARLVLGEAGGPGAAGISVRDLLGEVPLDLRAVLGEARFNLDELSSLQPGDVIALERKSSEPIDIEVGATVLFRARAGLSGQMVALEVVG